MLSIEQATIGGHTVLRLKGRVTAGHNIQDLARIVDDFNQAGVRRVIIDLTGAELLDSTGLGLIIMYAQNLKNSGGQMSIAGAAGPVAHTLALCKVSDIVPIFATYDQAASSFSKAAGA